ncbi:MAG: histidine kinase, partial [bacterium]|nr:histidine kinase [bacterium]
MPRAAIRFWRYPPVWKWTALISTMLAITTAGCLAACVLLVWRGYVPREGLWGFYWGSLRIALLLGTVGAAGSTLYETMRLRMEKTALDLKTVELDRQRAWNAATTARLASLESRVHPHFLFNALNSISSLIPDDPGRAERLVERMAALLRFSLDSR